MDGLPKESWNDREREGKGMWKREKRKILKSDMMDYREVVDGWEEG